MRNKLLYCKPVKFWVVHSKSYSYLNWYMHRVAGILDDQAWKTGNDNGKVKVKTTAKSHHWISWVKTLLFPQLNTRNCNFATGTGHWVQLLALWPLDTWSCCNLCSYYFLSHLIYCINNFWLKVPGEIGWAYVTYRCLVCNVGCWKNEYLPFWAFIVGGDHLNFCAEESSDY